MTPAKPFGLYIHIPFCSSICHYCDFNKTAAYSSFTNFFTALSQHLTYWLKELNSPNFSSVFFGGGTPSLFAKEYEDFFSLLNPHLQATCEITLEANPEDITAEKLQAWKSLGFNRLSMGVQTFQPRGLTFLTRAHKPAQILSALEMSKSFFTNVNLDLIYGWQDQTMGEWTLDLKQAIACDIPHLSLYNLTYEPRTVIGRRQKRQVIKAAHDDLLANFYDLAKSMLADAGFRHEEISNWSKPGFSCKHNWLYWQNQFYLGIGPGAHGYLPCEKSAIGKRYIYAPTVRKFVQNAAPDCVQIEVRNTDDWLTEYIGCSLRTRAGTDLRLAEQNSGKRFASDARFQQFMAEKYLRRQGDQLLLNNQEWFRENYWCLQVLSQFH